MIMLVNALNPSILNRNSLMNPVKVLVAQSCLTRGDPMNCSHQAPLFMEFPGRNTGVGYNFLLQGVFLTLGLNLGFLHFRQILYGLSHQGSPSWTQTTFQLAYNIFTHLMQELTFWIFGITTEFIFILVRELRSRIPLVVQRLRIFLLILETWIWP